MPTLDNRPPTVPRRPVPILVRLDRASADRPAWRNSRRGVLFACAFVLAVASPLSAIAQWPKAWSAIAQRHGLDPAVLYSAALMSSGRSKEGQYAPWPWTLRVDGRIEHYASRSEAQAALKRFIDQGTNLIGQRLEIRLGILGIPLERIAPGQNALDALDPQSNLDQGGALLAGALREGPEALARLLADSQAAERIRALAKTLNSPRHSAPAVRRIDGARRYAACAPQAKRPVAQLVEAAARRHGVDPAFALAVASRESALRQSAVSPKGARGVMQLMPATAARYGADASDLAQNIDAGTRYLRDLAELFGSDPRLVAAGYNAGEGAVLRHARQVPPFRETQAYVPAVLAARQEYTQCAAR